MRGTGCSGGAFDFFEPLQSLDGYDVIETIARQPWVLHHKVGMMGISYGGISQLFTAADRAAEPGRDRAALGDRQHADDALPGRHPQHRASRSPGRRSGSTTPLPASADRRPGLGLPADPGRRPDLHGQPGAPRRGGRPAGEDPGQRPLRADGRRPAVADHLRQQDQRADVHGLPVDRRADRRPLPRPGRALHRHARASGSRSPTAPTSTRSTRRRSTAGTTSSSSTSRSRRRSLNSAVIHAAAPRDLPGGDGDHRA